MGSKLDEITHSIPLIVIKFSEAGYLFWINLLLIILICVLGGIAGYAASLNKDNTRLNFRRMVTVSIYSVFYGLSLGMMLSLLIGACGPIVAGMVAGFNHESLHTANYAKIWKAAINSFVCITRREKMKDEDF